MIAWIAAALIMPGYSTIDLKRAKGLSMIDIETEPALLQEG